MPQGTTIVNFGSFPGSSDASVAVIGQAGILSGSLVEAWILPAVTADHSSDEHVMEPLDIYAGNIIPGTGFTIYAISRNHMLGIDSARMEQPPLNDSNVLNVDNPMPYGQFNVAWVWN